MEDLYLPEDDPQLDDIEETNGTLTDIINNDAYSITDPEGIRGSFKNPISSTSGPDKTQFDKLNFKVYNLTMTHRRQADHVFDPFSKDFGKFDKADTAPQNDRQREAFELEKIWKVQQLGLQLLIHTRHKIAGAMKQRDAVRADKKYRLGYLFCRLRRLKLEMYKMIAFGFEQVQATGGHRETVLMRLYQEVVRMEQDIKDILKLTRHIEERGVETEGVTEPAVETIPTESMVFGGK